MILVDAFDSNDVATGQTLELQELYKQGLWYRGVHLLVTNRNREVLLQKRSATQHNFPNAWDMTMGGMVDVGEEPLMAIIREVREELGVDIETDWLTPLGVHADSRFLPADNIKANVFNYCYQWKTELDPTQLHLQLSEASEVTWVTRETIEESLVTGKVGNDLLAPAQTLFAWMLERSDSL